jgi:hypothetical protein
LLRKIADMHEFKLKVEKGHLFVDVAGADWLLDTGAPSSFGANAVVIGVESFSVPDSYMGLDVEQLSGFVNYPVAGLVGTDILNNFDISIDTKKGIVVFSKAELNLDGEKLPITEFMGIPIIQAKIDGSERNMFFDTGAQISYFQDDSLTAFPSLGSVSDFYPGFGEFDTETYQVVTMLGNEKFELTCGSLPGMLGMTLDMANVEGIVGNEILDGRILGYFPRRQLVVIS